MDIQRALLSKVIHDQSIVQAINARITPDFFPDDRYRRIYVFLLNHWSRFGTPADEAVVKASFPSYNWPVEEQSLDYFIDGLRQRRKKSLLTAALNEAASFLNTLDEPDHIDFMEEVLRDALMQSRLETTPTLDLDLSNEGGTQVIEGMLDERLLDPGYLRGISTGFTGIDLVTGGLQPEQLIVLIGLPKSLKSSNLLYMALACHSAAKVPLFLGFEMSNYEQIDRLLSIEGQVALTKITNGTMNAREYRQVIKALHAKREMRPFILSVDMDSAMTVSGVQAKIMEYQPDAVFIDGAYLMQSEIPKVEQGSDQALRDIARSLKRLAQNLHIPIVVTSQASQFRSRRGKLTAESAMYTQAWRQSADVLLGSERVEDEPGVDSGGEVRVKVKVLDSRSGPRAETEIVWDWKKGLVTEMTIGKFDSKADDDDDD